MASAGPILVTSDSPEDTDEEEEEEYKYKGPDDLFDAQADAKDEAFYSARSPETSDAVLSCPQCFRVVCMDCQQHERYENQYRAMFVMGITVDWNDNNRLRYDDARQGLIRTGTGSTRTGSKESTGTGGEWYYAVSCANCQTQVAALDMKDEVYHFFGCVASTS
jgi:hypothetical protein